MDRQNSYLTVGEVALLLKCKEQTVRKYVRDGKLKRVPMKMRRVFIDKKSVEELLNPTDKDF